MKKNLLTVMAAVLVCASCAKEMQEVSQLAPEQQTLMTKLVGGSQGELIPGKILIKMDELSTKEISCGNFSTFNGIEGVKITPALPIQPKNAEVARKYGLHQWFTVEFDAQVKPEAMATRLAGLKQVEAVQYDRYIERIIGGDPVEIDMTTLTKSAAAGDIAAPKDAAQFNDTYFHHQWNLVNDGTITDSAVEGADVGVKDAWRLTAGDPSVVVAVFDCAVNSVHEDLVDALWKNQAEIDGQMGVDDDGNGYIDDKYGFNFVGCFALNESFVNNKLEGKPAANAVKGNLLNWSAGSGHGTHVAGIIGATNNNGKGVSSIAGGTGNGDGVRLMTCQIFEGNKASSDAQSAAAFIYAADNGACIAQCSYGTSYIIQEDDLYQITYNLVENGIKYNVPGGTLSISLHRQEDMAVLRISDTGTGIPPESLSHVFERFYRVDKARSRQTGGSGLGLAIVRSMVERNNGEIHLQSTVGKGTTFTVFFPCFDLSETELPPDVERNEDLE